MLDPAMPAAGGPPRNHPEWQGSVPHKWMDPGSGRTTRRTCVDSVCRDGSHGISRQGLSGYFTDLQGRAAEERSQGVRICKDIDRRPWGERETTWRPSRRSCVQPSKSEPTLLSKRPPFVQRHGSHILKHHARPLSPGSDDWQADRFCVEAARRKSYQRWQAARQDEQLQRSLVRDLDQWERDHVVRRRAPPAMTSTVSGAAATLGGGHALGSRSAYGDVGGRDPAFGRQSAF
eukprot:TRINITY_DN33116_c0_g1_i1.p1 TRINITY_DN33116_c0_g1~~TRINITY_DN33116_c0_g1_i1.p1  ORF type:complete len:233 (-),score=25.24 TRINITY_DN33116_c0_g1_i1:371-1069(-)